MNTTREASYSIQPVQYGRFNWPALVLAFIAGGAVAFGYESYHSASKNTDMLVQAEQVNVLLKGTEGPEVAANFLRPTAPQLAIPLGKDIAAKPGPASEPEPAVAPPKPEPPVEAGAVAPGDPSPPAPVAAAKAKVDKAPVVKPVASQSKPAIAPKREPWQEAIVRQNKGIHKADRAPKELDLRAFEGIDPGMFRDWTAEEWWDWSLASTTAQVNAVPEVIRHAFEEQHAARLSAYTCFYCTSDTPKLECKKFSRKEVQQACAIAPDYRGMDYKPLQLLPAVNPSSR